MFNVLEVSLQAAALPDFVSRSLSTGMNATVSAPLDNAKNIRSGILNAAKYALLLKLLKSELIREVRRSPSKILAREKLDNKNAAEPMDSLFSLFPKNFAMNTTNYRVSSDQKPS